jgi:hypothetical protein
MMSDDLLAEVRRLSDALHRDDPPPQNARERQAAVVLTQLPQLVLDLLLQGVTPHILELALFYQWVRLSALLHGLSQTQCDAWTTDMGAIMEPLAALLTDLEPTLTDTGPTPAMQALGDNIQQLKDVLQALVAQPLSQADLLRHTDRTNRAAFGLVGACLDARIPPGFITTVLLYY